jgi:VanZ family protein
MFFKYNFPAILWGLIILILLGMPGNDIPKFPWLEHFHFDKVVHFFLFAVFTILLIRGFKKQTSFTVLQKYSVLTALLFGIFYGAILEYLQGVLFINRTSDIHDLIANMIGSFIGLPLLWIIQKIEIKKSLR